MLDDGTFSRKRPVQPMLLADLSPCVLGCLKSKATVRQFERGSTICLQGEPAEAVKIVRKGWVKLYRVSPSGSEAILATLSEGESFDEISGLNGGTCAASVEAVTDCSIMFVDLAALNMCANAQREISSAILSVASSQMDNMLSHIEQLKVKNGVQRLAEYLLGQCGTTTGPSQFDLPYEKHVLAGKLGMKPESLSRAFKRLKAAGVKSDLKHIQVSDVRALEDFAEALDA
jgi:CRP-like cAMP-binding protein